MSYSCGGVFAPRAASRGKPGFVLQVVGQFLVVLEIDLGIFPSLGDPVGAVAIQAPLLAMRPWAVGQIQQVAFPGNALAVDDVEFRSLKAGPACFFTT